MYAHTVALTQVYTEVLNVSNTPRGACCSKLALYVSLSAVNTNMQQYNWIIGAIISATVSCVLRSEQSLYSRLKGCAS